MISLRSLETEKTDQTDDSGKSIEYAHQWIVRGHFRNQFYPSEKTNRLIWIDPYKKGPEGAPLLETVKVLRR